MHTVTKSRSVLAALLVTAMFSPVSDVRKAEVAQTVHHVILRITDVSEGNEIVSTGEVWRVRMTHSSDLSPLDNSETTANYFASVGEGHITLRGPGGTFESPTDGPDFDLIVSNNHDGPGLFVDPPGTGVYDEFGVDTCSELVGGDTYVDFRMSIRTDRETSPGLLTDTDLPVRLRLSKADSATAHITFTTGDTHIEVVADILQVRSRHRR